MERDGSVKSMKGSAASSILQNPSMVIMPVSFAIGSTIAYNSVSEWIAPAIFVLSTTALAVVIRSQVKAEAARKHGKRNVDYRTLASLDVLRLEPWLEDNVRGHDATIHAIIASLQRSLQLSRAGRTLGSFLLVGPPGTGKVFMSQLIATGLFPDSDVVLIPMNQVKDSGSVAALTGPRVGAGSNDVGGRLTEPVLENPYRVIILDGLENAHRDVQACLGDILDRASCREGGTGSLVDFSGCVFFATSNSAVEELRGLAAELGTTTSSSWLGRSRELLAETTGFDRSFLARWDAICLMDKLSPLHTAEVACLQLAKYFGEYGIALDSVDPLLILDLVESNAAFSAYGVQQLPRLIREKTEWAILEARRDGSRRINLTDDRVRQKNLERTVPR
jgi:ATP-dependent Clp protease ATP-binding subunit ClpA